MDDLISRRLEIVGHLRGLLDGRDTNSDPFLKFLPDMLENPGLVNIDPNHALKFTELALKYNKTLLIQDALKILNKIVDPEDGSLKIPGSDMFYDNRNFFWKELGDHTNAVDVILHIFNKTIFLISLGKE